MMDIRDFITRHEGRRNRPYQCTAGRNTIGVGWNMDANRLPGDVRNYLNAKGYIEDKHIDRLLGISINTARYDCRKLFPDFEKFSENRRTALTDFMFQMGRPRASKFVNMVAAVNTGRWEDAAREMRDSNYYRQATKRAEEVSRLLEEG